MSHRSGPGDSIPRESGSLGPWGPACHLSLRTSLVTQSESKGSWPPNCQTWPSASVPQRRALLCPQKGPPTPSSLGGSQSPNSPVRTQAPLRSQGPRDWTCPPLFPTWNTQTPEASGTHRGGTRGGTGWPPGLARRTAKRTNGKAEPSSRAQGQDGCGPALTGHSPEAPGAWAGSGAQRGLTPASATRLEMAEAALLRQVPGRMPPAGMPTHFTWRRSSKKKQLWKRNHGPRGKRHALNIVTLMKTSH